MKLQITPTTSARFATEVGDHTSLWEAVTKIIAVFKANTHTPFTRKDVDAVVKALGYDEVTDAALYPQVNHLHRPKRGYYSLDAAPEEGAATPAPAPKVKAPAPTPKTVTVETADGVVWVPDAPTPENAGYYAEDIGLRRIAVTESTCYGHYSASHKACGTCPLAGFCAPASVGGMGDISARLDKATEKHLADAKRAAVAPPAPTPDPYNKAPEPAPAPTSGAEPEYPPGANVLDVPFEGICTKCGNTIAEGALGVHVAGEGMLHPDCARIN